MKKAIGFLFFLWTWAATILLLPDLLEKIGKWVPILKYLARSLIGAINFTVKSLPQAPNCGPWICWQFLLFWPTLISMAVLIIFYAVFAILYLKLDPYLSKHKSSIPIVLLLGQMIVLILTQDWLLYQYSEISLINSISFVSFSGRYQAAIDKNYFLHASNIYGIIIAVTYLSLVLLLRWAWVRYSVHKPAVKAAE
jgi:hypothetical protein